jgi:SPP1 gp7 family putative phage head morphogenesis protein
MSIENSFIRKQILNQRFVRSLTDTYMIELTNLFERVAARMDREPNNERLRAIRADLSTVIVNRMDELGLEITADMREFASSELEFTADVINANSKVLLSVPDVSVVERALTLSELDLPVGAQSLTMAMAITEFAEAQAGNIRRIISDGILLGDDIRSMSRAVRELSEGRSRAQAEALTRTLVNHTSAQAHKVFLEENASAFDGDEWVAVLDSRTTLICGGRDGTVYPIGKGPYPPAHWNCRSLRIPVLSKQFEAATQKSNRKDFDTWLKGQDAEFQDEYFSQFANGKEKSALFRRGGLDIQRFRDETGKNYSLDQLRGLYPVAFDKANLTKKPTGL